METVKLSRTYTQLLLNIDQIQPLVVDSEQAFTWYLQLRSSLDSSPVGNLGSESSESWQLQRSRSFKSLDVDICALVDTY